MIRVKCTREGLVSQLTASGHIIQVEDWFCALPSVRALRRTIKIWTDDPNQYASRAYWTVPVLDVGPWNTHDDAYVFNGARPQAESGVDTRGRPTNGSGIDLSDLVYKTLGEPEFVWWEWV